MKVSLTSREATAIRNALNGHAHSDREAHETAKKKFEKIVQDDAARIVRKVVSQ